MKSLLLLGAFILMSHIANAQSFSIISLQNSNTITVGETVKVSIALIPQGGFNQTIFLSAAPTTTFMGSITFSDPAPNPPYSNIFLSIKPTIQDTGLKTFILTGKNGTVKSVLTITLTTLKNPQWSVVNGPKDLKWGPEISLKKDIGGDICFSMCKNNITDNENTAKVAMYHYRKQQWEVDNFSIGFNLQMGNYEDYITHNYDKKGILWFGTSRGLGRYDGNFTSLFNSVNSQFPINPIITVQIDKNDHPVCFAYGGKQLETAVTYYDGATWRSHKPIITNSQNQAYWVSRFCIDSSNRIWIPSTRGGIIRIQDTIQESITINSNPPLWNNDVDNVICDKDGDIWCLYHYGNMTNALSHFNGTTWQHISTPTKASIYTFIIDDDKNIWVGSAEGLHKYDGTSWTIYNKNNSPLPGGVRHIIQDKNKNIWTFNTVAGATYQKFYVFNPTGIIDIPVAPLDVEEQSVTTDNIQIFPNPTSSIFTIEGIVGGSLLRLMNSLGVEVLSQNTTSDKTQIDVSSLPSGLYFVNVRTGTETVVKPIVVSH
ncbi:MAG: T9SS type A sorting domain-containing protein [Ignavibacteriae bacterium]|nr:T9SS type A sorting domain-containing protein [Ignavibacteriota bacterium]